MQLLIQEVGWTPGDAGPRTAHSVPGRNAEATSCLPGITELLSSPREVHGALERLGASWRMPPQEGAPPMTRAVAMS